MEDTMSGRDRSRPLGSDGGEARSTSRRRRRAANNGNGRGATSLAVIPCASLCILSMIGQTRAHRSTLRTVSEQRQQWRQQRQQWQQQRHRQRQQQQPQQQRSLQGSFSVGSSVDLDSCYAALYSSDSDGNGKLSQDEFLDFVQTSADGKLDTNQYGIPITFFYLLPQEFIGLYNYFACGNANYGCPSVEGIDIDGVAGALGGEGEEEMTEQQVTLLFQLCKVTEAAVDKITERPTNGPTVGVTAPKAPTASPTLETIVTASPTAATTTTPPTAATTTAPPTAATTAAPPTAAPTMAPQTLFPCPPLYIPDFEFYTAGSLISKEIGQGSGRYQYYRCKPFPQSGWCEQAAYEPGTTLNWAEAWTLFGWCDGSGLQPWASPTGAPSPDFGSAEPTPFEMVPPVAAVPTRGPTPPPAAGLFPTYPPTVVTSAPTVKATPEVTTPPPAAAPGATPGGTDEELYSGPLSTTFQYEIYNTLGLDAESILTGTNPENDEMAVLLEGTTAFVEGVVAAAFGEEQGQEGVDHNNVNRRIGGNGQDGGEGIRRLRGGRSFFEGRGLEVLLPPESVSIADVEDVECSEGPQPTSACQKVTAATNLLLLNEPRNTTLLQFNSAVNRALEDPGVAFPPDGSIFYVGPASKSGIITIPGVTKPENPPAQVPPEQEDSGGTPGWVVPVSIAGAAIGSIALLLFVGSRRQKRQRTAKEYDSHARPHSVQDADLLGLGREVSSGGSYEAEIQLRTPTKVSPLDSDGGEGGLQPVNNIRNPNPFLQNDSNSGSDSSSVPSGSYSASDFSSHSDSSSTSSDIHDVNAAAASSGSLKDFWKRKEAEAQSQQPPLPQQPVRPSTLAAVTSAALARDSGHMEQEQNANRLQTLHEVSEENLSMASGLSRRSDGSLSKSDKSVYRAGVEALVKEACPDKYDKIDEMMIEYEGREEVLIGHLSAMLASKKRATTPESKTEDSGGSGDDDDDDKEKRSTMSSKSTLNSEWSMYSLSTATSGYLSSAGTSGRTISTQGSAHDSSRNPPQEKQQNSEAAFETKNEPRPRNPFDEVNDGQNAAVVTAGSAPAAAVETKNKPRSRNPFDEENDSVNAAVVAAGSASAAATAALLGDDDGLNDSDASSSAGSSDWSSDDGFSSIDTSSFATNDTAEEGRPAMPQSLHRMSDASDASGVGNLHGAPNPMFEPVDGPFDGEEDVGIGRSKEVERDVADIATRNDLDEAIKAGDWKAVGATAALIANISPPSKPPSNKDDFNSSNFSVSSQEKHQVQELENLVEAGDWSAVMAAASRFETETYTDNLMESRQSLFDDSLTGPEMNRESSPKHPPKPSTDSIGEDSPQSKGSDWSDSNPESREEIEELVKSVVPEELENIDEMLLQFRGREEELLNTLRTMERKGSLGSDASVASKQSDVLSSPEPSLFFESDREDSTTTSAAISRMSSNGASSNGGPAASIPEEHDSHADYDSTIATDQEELLICTSCSRHLPRSDYSEAQLLLVNIDGARCNECDALAH